MFKCQSTFFGIMSLLSPWRRLLRRRRLLAVSILLTVFFVSYQLLSVGQLGKELAKRRPKSKLQTNFRHYEKADGFIHIKSDDENDENRHKLQEFQGKGVFQIDKKNIVFIKFGNISQGVLGVLPRDQILYLPTNSAMFRCTRSGKEIPFTLVNDDYCDCDDLSDEPSTSACSNSRFFCYHQPMQVAVPLSVKSSMVNDGICDCCDGSDEWKNNSPPEHTRLSVDDQEKVGIYQVPCKNHC